MRFRWSFVLPLAISQLVSWGSLYHAFAVIAGPMSAEMRWSSTAVNGALSAGLVSTGLASFASGWIIDTYGGRMIMTMGSLAAMCLLFAWSYISDIWQVYAVWIAMGAVLSTVLYELVFAVMARELKGDYRRGIITITLLGGLASTVFVPLTHFLIERLDLRSALQVLAALQIPFGIVIHWLVLKQGDNQPVSMHAAVPSGRVKRAMPQPVFWFLALSYAAHSFMLQG